MTSERVSDERLAIIAASGAPQMDEAQSMATELQFLRSAREAEPTSKVVALALQLCAKAEAIYGFVHVADEEARNAWASYCETKANLFKAATGTLAHPSPSTEGLGVRVKGLEWNGDEAETPFGKYREVRTEDGYALTFGYEELAHLGFNAVGPFESARDDAVSRAQPHYEHCILSALSTSAEQVRVPLIDSMTDEEFNQDRSDENPTVGFGKSQMEQVEITDEMVERLAREMASDDFNLGGDTKAVRDSVIGNRWRDYAHGARRYLTAALSPSPKKEG